MRKNHLNISRLLRLTSRIFDPGITGLLVLVIVAVEYNLLLSHALIILLIQIVIPLAVFIYGVVQGKYDIDMSDRNRRIPLLILGTGVTVVSFLLVVRFGYNDLLIPYATMVGLFMTFGVITVFWKISAHAFVHSLFIIILGSFISPWFYILFITTLPLVGYSRVKMKKHTVGQVLSGALLTLLIIPAL